MPSVAEAEPAEFAETVATLALQSERFFVGEAERRARKSEPAVPSACRSLARMCPRPAAGKVVGGLCEPGVRKCAPSESHSPAVLGSSQNLPKQHAKQLRGMLNRDSERPKVLLERLCRPNVVAIEGDMLPAERGEAGQQKIGDWLALPAQFGNGTAEIDGVPEDNGCHGETEPGGSIPLVLKGTVSYFAEAQRGQAFP